MIYKAEKELDAKYDHKAIEDRCMEFWEQNQVYKFDPATPRENIFAVDTPPPYVSGNLHMGHAYSYTQAEILIRFQRMNGKHIFYPVGWDDNGLPTERRVQLNYNIKVDPTIPYDPNFKPKMNFKERPELVSRRNFIEICIDMITKDSLGFEAIMRRLGWSIDYSIKYSTIGKVAMKVAQENFIKLCKSGQAYLAEAPAMWDTGLHTAVANAEIEDREIPGAFHDIRFKCEGDEFVIATTRPELLPAIIAIVAHPDDTRYKKFFGKMATAPLFGASVPVMASEHADPEKGTGIMMVCTFGDQEDVKFWKTHNLPLRQIIGRDGRIFGVDGLEGLTIKQARKQIVEMLRASGDLIGEPRPIMHSVKFYEKGDLPVEFVPARQWFVKTLDIKDKIAAAGQKIKWTPNHMNVRLQNWAEGLNQDWAISRQRFFGEPFPVWYKLDTAGNPDYDNPILADVLPCDPATDLPAGFTESQRGAPDGFVAEGDVMDTWATSSVSPLITMASVNGEHNLAGAPFDVRPNGHEIIRTWDFYTIAQFVMGQGGMLPWEQLWISGMALDKDGKKMSKSKGNGVEPADWVERFGSDAVRLWAGAFKLGSDAQADEKIAQAKRKLVMKFWNAAKFSAPLIGHGGITADVDNAWIRTIGDVAADAKKCFIANDQAAALIGIEAAFWDFCDNYLEIVKGRAYAGDVSAKTSLFAAMDIFCRLFAPFAPFVAEEVYQALELGEGSVHAQPWPVVQADVSGDTAGYARLCELVKIVRGKKSENNFSMKKEIAQLVVADDVFLRSAETDIKNVLNAKEILFSGADLVGELVWGE